MPSDARPAKLHPAAHEALQRLQSALAHQGIPVETHAQTVLSALVMYTTPEQALGMVLAFARYTAGIRESASAGSDDRGASE